MRSQNMRRRRSGSSLENALVVDKDLLLNLLVVFLLLIGQQSLLTSASVSDDGLREMPKNAIKLFLTNGGQVRTGTLDGPEISVEELRATVTNLIARSQDPVAVVLHHGEHPPGGTLHQVLWEIEQAAGAVPTLALVEYLEARGSEGNTKGNHPNAYE